MVVKRRRRQVDRPRRQGAAPHRKQVRPAQVLLVLAAHRMRRLQLRRPAAGAGGGGGGRGGGGRGGGATAAPAGFFPTPQFGRGAAPQLGPGASRGPWGLGPQGLPLVKPPYGRITAYNMNSGDIAWQVANGETYDWIKNHPALKGVTIPKTGRADEGGIVVTKTLLFAGQGCGLFRSGVGRQRDVLRVRQGYRRGRP